MTRTEPYTLRPVGRCRGPVCAGVTMLLSQGAWNGIEKSDRPGAAVAFARHAARGLCTRCYEVEAAAGRREDHETRHTPTGWRVEDYELIRGELPCASARARLRAAGERFGCHPDTVRLALRRHGVQP